MSAFVASRAAAGSRSPTADELATLRARCTRALTHHISVSPRDAFATLAARTPADLLADVYGSGTYLAEFEARVATELGKAAAVFLPTGTLAQQIALRIWCDRAANRVVAFHPLCHLEIHEARAYAMLHDLAALHVGTTTRLMTVDDLEALADPAAALIVELPQRELGGQLPAWAELVELCDVAQAKGMKLHLDGARLWEAAPYYGRSHAEICSRFDSVYVSFYKGLGALAGAVLAGDAAFIAQARVWQHRHGGRPITIAPYALSARAGFEENLPKMPGFASRAREIARKLDAIDGIEIVPQPPQTNMFHIYLRGERADLEARAHDFAREHGTFVFGRLAATAIPTLSKWEFVVGNATMALSTDEILRIVRTVVV